MYVSRHPYLLHRFNEALRDPKTWLFALFSALNNVPNSLTNQNQIIVASFGFTYLQTTLLGCVDGIIEIVTIFTGVHLAARLRDARAYVGALYFIPNLIGVLLLNVLPWSNRIGLLCANWLTGACVLRACSDHQCDCDDLILQAWAPLDLSSRCRGCRTSPQGTPSV